MAAFGAAHGSGSACSLRIQAATGRQVTGCIRDSAGPPLPSPLRGSMSVDPQLRADVSKPSHLHKAMLLFDGEMTYTCSATGSS